MFTIDLLIYCAILTVRLTNNDLSRDFIYLYSVCPEISRLFILYSFPYSSSYRSPCLGVFTHFNCLGKIAILAIAKGMITNQWRINRDPIVV
jgi:hypothetical protein